MVGAGTDAQPVARRRMDLGHPGQLRARTINRRPDQRLLNPGLRRQGVVSRWVRQDRRTLLIIMLTVLAAWDRLSSRSSFAAIRTGFTGGKCLNSRHRPEACPTQSAKLT